MLELVNVGQELRRCLVQDLVLEAVDTIVQGFEQREERIDKLVDHQVLEKAGVALGQLGAEPDPGCQLDQKLGGLIVNGDQVVLGHEHVVLVESDFLSRCEHCGEDHDERVPVVLLELRSLVLVLDVLDGQVVEAEDLFQQLEVVGVGTLDVKPEPVLLANLESGSDRLVGRLVERGALGRDERAHVGPTVALTP